MYRTHADSFNSKFYGGSPDQAALTTISSVKEGEQGNAAQAPVPVVGSTVDEQVASAEHLDIFAEISS